MGRLALGSIVQLFPVGFLIFAQCQLFGFAFRHHSSSLADNRLGLSGAESILADDDIAFARAVHVV